MRFTMPSVSRGKHLQALPYIWRERFVCGGVLLAVGGWVALHPPPRAPRLPMACKQSRQGLPLEAGGESQILVWVDVNKGLYYFRAHPAYGQSPGGRLMDVKAAKAGGYRSGTHLR